MEMDRRQNLGQGFAGLQMYNRSFNARAGGVCENGLQTFKTFQEQENLANLYKQGNVCFNQAAGSSEQQNIQGLT